MFSSLLIQHGNQLRVSNNYSQLNYTTWQNLDQLGYEVNKWAILYLIKVKLKVLTLEGVKNEVLA